jgi:hypothetical protein
MFFVYEDVVKEDQIEIPQLLIEKMIHAQLETGRGII